MRRSLCPSRTAMGALLRCAVLLLAVFTTLAAAQPGRACPGSISGRVIFDKNCNGKVDAGEPGLAGVTISLYDAGNNLLKTKVTTSTGYFIFGIMTLNAAYTVQVTVPGGYMATNALPGKAAQKIDLITLQVNVTLAGLYSGNKFLLCRSQNNKGPFTTFTQGGWGAVPHGGNPGAILHANFPTVYPSGLTIGGTNTIFFATADDITGFLPQGGTPGVLTQSYAPPLPGGTEAGVFAGQTLALQLNVDFSNAGVTLTGLGALHVLKGPLAGYTVDQVLALANEVLGGNVAALPAGMSISDLNDVEDNINGNYDDGTTDNGYLGP